MSKRPADVAPRGGNAKKSYQIATAVFDQKFTELQTKLKELNIEIDIKFINSMASSALSSKERLVEYLLQYNEKIKQYEFYRLKIWNEQGITPNEISSMLNTISIPDFPGIYAKLFDLCFIQEEDTFRPKKWLRDFSFFKRMLHSARSDAPGLLEQLVNKCFEHDGTEKKLFKTIKKYVLLDGISTTLADSGRFAVKNFDNFIKELFIKQDDGSYTLSASLQAVLDSLGKDYPKFFSCLSKSVRNAPQNYQNFIKVLFNEQDGRYTLKPEIEPARLNKPYVIKNILNIDSTKHITNRFFFDTLAEAAGGNPPALQPENVQTINNHGINRIDPNIAGPSHAVDQNEEIDNSDKIFENHLFEADVREAANGGLGTNLLNNDLIVDVNEDLLDAAAWQAANGEFGDLLNNEINVNIDGVDLLPAAADGVANDVLGRDHNMNFDIGNANLVDADAEDMTNGEGGNLEGNLMDLDIDHINSLAAFAEAINDDNIPSPEFQINENGEIEIVSVLGCASSSSRTKRSTNECLFTAEDVDKFYDSQKKQLNKENFFRTLEGMPDEAARLQLRQYVLELTGNINAKHSEMTYKELAEKLAYKSDANFAKGIRNAFNLLNGFLLVRDVANKDFKGLADDICRA